jgi:hypothetical protein
MGGFGSGKWMDVVGRNSAVEYSRVLSIKMLKEHGFFDSDEIGVIQWTNVAGEVVCCVEVETLLGGDIDKTPLVVVRSEVLSARGIEQKIKLTKTPCTYTKYE